MTTRAQVVTEARAWAYTPFVHQARLKGIGVDCIGLIIGVGKSLGLLPYDFDVTGYARVPDGVTLRAGCDAHMDPIPMSALQPGDVLLLAYEDDPQHLGFVGDYALQHGELSLIHAYGSTDGRGMVREERLTRRKRFKAIQGYALRGVE